jgi:flagellar biogenesis protein FliO
MNQETETTSSGQKGRVGGVAEWLLSRVRHARGAKPQLAVLERIALGPRQSLVLVEAEGRRLLVATSPEGPPAFYALDECTARSFKVHAPSPSDETRDMW